MNDNEDDRITEVQDNKTEANNTNETYKIEVRDETEANSTNKTYNINACVFSANGKYFATYSSEHGEVRTWVLDDDKDVKGGEDDNGKLDKYNKEDNEKIGIQQIWQLRPPLKPREQNMSNVDFALSDDGKVENCYSFFFYSYYFF